MRADHGGDGRGRDARYVYTCRSGPGEACSTYDPVRDLWTEPETPHRPRLKRAGLLA